MYAYNEYMLILGMLLTGVLCVLIRGMRIGVCRSCLYDYPEEGTGPRPPEEGICLVKDLNQYQGREEVGAEGTE